MKYLVACLLLILLAGPAWAADRANSLAGLPPAWSGSMLLWDDGTQLTDAAATHTQVLSTRRCGNLVIDAVSDKGMTVVVTPVLDESDETVLGAAGDTLSVADGGEQVRGIYTGLAAPKAKVTATKTEAGSSTTYRLTVRCTAQ